MSRSHFSAFICLPSLITELNFLLFSLFSCRMIRRSSHDHTGMISTSHCLLQDGETPPPANPADLVVSLQCSTGAPYRKWAHNCSFTPTASRDPLPPCSNPLQNHLCWSHRMPPPTNFAVLFYSWASSPNRTLNASARFTLRCLKNTTDLRYSGYTKQPKTTSFAVKISKSFLFFPKSSV